MWPFSDFNDDFRVNNECVCVCERETQWLPKRPEKTKNKMKKTDKGDTGTWS